MADNGCHRLSGHFFRFNCCFRFRSFCFFCFCFCSFLSFFLSVFRSCGCFFCSRFLCGSRFCRCLCLTLSRSRAALFRSSCLFLCRCIGRLILICRCCSCIIYSSFIRRCRGFRCCGFLSSWSVYIFRCGSCRLFCRLGNVVNLFIAICRLEALYSNPLGLFDLLYTILHPGDVGGAADRIFPVIHI